jgi:Tol biopolymer transport system component
MPLAPGTRLGPYEVLASIGAGGMGEVYRARDTRLNRDVALKVLPEVFSSDPERLARFTREAQTLAALNHPNIAQIHGLEESPSTSSGQAGRRALAMELVEGEDLSAAIARGPMPLSAVLAVARQIVDALDAAHEAGIVHRDLKPANIKVRGDGVVKVLDFGLAKATDASGRSGPGVENSPTYTARATELGLILGTAAYMAPEQAKGRPVDKRADIWAFGAVLFEMMTGRRAFEGEEITTVLARVLERDPDWSMLPAATPAPVRRLIERCLTKDVKARLRDIAEAGVALEDVRGASSFAAVSSGAAPAGAPARGGAGGWLPWIVAAGFAVAAAVLYVRAPSASNVGSGSVVRTELNLPRDVEFFSGPSISDDGSIVAFVGVGPGLRQIYVRGLDGLETKAIPGTEAVVTATLSPDGKAAAFVSNNTRLMRIDLTNLVVERLADGVSIFSGPAWMRDGSIVFSQGSRLVARGRDGGERELARIDQTAGDISFAWPVVAGGEGPVLFLTRRRTSGGAQTRLECVPAAGGARTVLIEGVRQAIFASADRVVYEREGALFVAGFDAAKPAIVGSPERLAESPLVGSIGGVGAAVAPTGALVMASPAVLDSQLSWLSLNGSERLVGTPTRGYLNPRVSPDGRFIAFSDAGVIWTLDNTRHTFSRVSSTDPDPTVGFPLWSNDGTHLYYRTADGMRLRRADGEGDSRVLPNTGPNDYPGAVTPDGTTLVLTRLAGETGGDLYSTPASGGEVKPLLVTPAYEGGAQVSRDGKWLLYVSNESGRFEMYVRPLSGPDRKYPVSSGGGTHGLWSRDGRRIFYRSGQKFFAVDITTTPDVQLGTPVFLFERRQAFGQNLTIPNYSLSHDGRDFLMVREEPGGRHLSLVQNWLSLVARPR